MRGGSAEAVAMEAWAFPPQPDTTYRPPDDAEFWFPHRETMDPEAREVAIVERLREVMRYAVKRSPFYRRKWAEAGVTPDDIGSLDDYQRIPVVTKDELRLAQEAHPPFGDYLCVEEDEVARVHGTSGTTGQPTAFAISAGDWDAIGNAHARVLWSMGVRPSDTVFVGAIFSLYMGSWGALVGAERLGARVFPFGAGVPGMTARAVDWLRRVNPAVFYGTPSYALRLTEVAEEMHVDPKEFGLRSLVFSGEPGASIPAIRSQIEDAFDAEVFDCGSMAEMTPWMALGETRGHAGMLCWQDIVYTEVVDPVTKLRVPYGGEGTPVYTHLERTSQPMVRLLSGDMTRWQAPGSPCGRTYPTLPQGIYGRIDDMFTIRGENVYPSAIDDIVTRMEGYGGEHQIIVSRSDAMDALAVRVEYDQELDGREDAIRAYTQRLEQELQRVLGVRARVEPLAQNTLERTDLKSRRVLDERDLFRSLVK